MMQKLMNKDIKTITKKAELYKEKLTFFERLQLYLFDDDKSIPYYHSFTKKELEIKHRYANVFAYWIDKPTISEKKIVQYIEKTFNIEKSQAYRDINYIKILLGNVKNASKEWQRYKVIAMIDKAYEVAENKHDAKSMIMAANVLGRYTQLDKEEILKLRYGDIVPQSWEITGDVTVLGIKPIDNLKEKQKKMREKYGGDFEEAEVLNE